MTKYKLEYIWLDGYTPTPNLRGKTQIKEFAAFPKLDQLPLWGFDGSSTLQAEGHNSDCVLKPVAIYPDGARTNGALVMCEVMMPHGKTPHPSNKRATILDDEGAWFGYEQEYFLYKDGRPLGFPSSGYPAPQGPYYTGVGYKNVGDIARKMVEEHLDLCLAAGINHEGINAEVAKGQWEFQIFALYQLGRAYAANRQMQDAIGVWRKAADRGSTSAMVELGVLYGTGSGVARDEAQARKLFERAAEAGNPRGVSNLAALGGGGVPSDPARARELLAKAAETNAEAQYQLGLMMADGAGGAKDDVGARNLFGKAAAQNHAGALERLGAFTQEGRGGPKDSAAAKAYYERAAALGDEDAKRALKRIECPYAIKDKRGNLVTNLCF